MSDIYDRRRRSLRYVMVLSSHTINTPQPSLRRPAIFFEIFFRVRRPHPCPPSIIPSRRSVVFMNSSLDFSRPLRVHSNNQHSITITPQQTSLIIPSPREQLLTFATAHMPSFIVEFEANSTCKSLWAKPETIPPQDGPQMTPDRREALCPYDSDLKASQVVQGA